MTPLLPLLQAEIATSGPMSMARYMTLCLSHPDHGYYTTRDPLGRGGDFITSPEISQMFGELLGLSLAQAWIDQGAPGRFNLVELGPGRGTLMADLMRAAAKVPGFAEAAQICLVEISPHLRQLQAQALRAHAPRWIDSVEDLDDAPLYLVANEFFDALPLRQFQRHASGWAERVIGLDEQALTLGLAPPAPIAALDHRLGDTKPGDIVEICPQAASFASQIATRIARDGGAALIVDYGDWRSQGDTVQAMQSHTFCEITEAPGQSDLTAHVDFEPIALAAKDAGCAHSRLTPQGVFLERLGITARAQALTRNLHPQALKAHIAAHRRLTHPDEMGQLFKVLGLMPKGSAPPPGLDP